MQVGATNLIGRATNVMLQHAREEDRWNLYLCVRRMADQIRPIDDIYICLYHQDRDLMSFVFLSAKRLNAWDGETRHGREQKIGDGPTSIVIRTGKIFEVGPPEERPPDLVTETFCSSKQSQSGLHIPILSGQGDLIGVLGLFSDTKNAFDPFFICVYQMLAGWLGICLDDEGGTAQVVNTDEIEPMQSPISVLGLSRDELIVLVRRCSGFTTTGLLLELPWNRTKYFKVHKSAFKKVNLPTSTPPEFIRKKLEALALPLSEDEIDLHFDQTNLVLDTGKSIIEYMGDEET